MGTSCAKEAVTDDDEATALTMNGGSPPPVTRTARGTSLLRDTRLIPVDEQRDVTFTEFFFDILYVLPLQNMFQMSISAAAASASASSFSSSFGAPGARLDCLSHFFLIWPALFNSWLGEEFFNTRFDTDDIIGRLQALLAMVGVVGMAAGIPSDSQTFAVFYAFTRLVLVSKYVRAHAWYLPCTKSHVADTHDGLMTGFIVFFTTGIMLWAAAAVVSEPLSRWLAAAGLLVEYAAPFLLLRQMVNVHSTHMPERFACITMLMFAGNLFALLNTGPKVGGVTGWALRPVVFSLLGISMPVLHIYLYGAELGMDTRGFHRNMKVKLRSYCHLYLHMPMCGAVQLTSMAVSHIQWPEGTVDATTRLLMCEGVAAFLFILSIIHLTGATMNRRRAAIRATSALVIALTPLVPVAPMTLPSSSLVSSSLASSSSSSASNEQYDAVPYFCVIVGVAAVQVLLDSLEAVIPRHG